MMHSRQRAPQLTRAQAQVLKPVGDCASPVISTRTCSPPPLSVRLCGPSRSARGRSQFTFTSDRVLITKVPQFAVEIPKSEKVRTGPPIYARRAAAEVEDEEAFSNVPDSDTTASPLLSPLPQQMGPTSVESHLESYKDVTSCALQSCRSLEAEDSLALTAMGVICPGAAVRICGLSSIGLETFNDMRAVVLQNIPGSGKWLVEIEGNTEVQLALLSENLMPEKEANMGGRPTYWL